MSQPPSLISDAPPAEPRAWNEIWVSALTQPSVGTFQEILEDPKASNARAYRWVFLSALAGSAIAAGINLLFSGYLLPGALPPSGSSPSPSGPEVLPFGPGDLIAIAVLALLITFLFIDGVLLTQFLAHQLGGKGTSRQLMWATAAYVAPLTLLSTALSAIAVINWTAILAAVYGVPLNWIAIKTVNQFGWAKAIAVGVIAPLVLLLLAIVVLSLLSPLLYPNITR